MNDKKVIVFGTGSYMKKNFHILRDFTLTCFWDNNDQLVGGTVLSLPVYKPTVKNNNESVFIVIASSFYDEIRNQLEGLGFTYQEDFCYLYDIANFLNISIVPNGHYYSPIPNVQELFIESPDTRYQRSIDPLGIDLNYQSQLDYFNLFLQNNEEFNSTLFNRFSLSNGFFEYADALSLYTIYKEKRPKQVIEVGSGYSSALFLDCNNFLQTNTAFTFIEPYPERLYSILNEENLHSTTIYENKVQAIHPSVFEELNENDILFIDSSHVSKFESDVNYLFFEILPRLKKGVIIHIHDIFNNFEYPTEWLYQENRFWNESYIVRAFLQFNDLFKIIFWDNYMLNKHPESAPEKLNGFGCSMWIEKVK